MNSVLGADANDPRGKPHQPDAGWSTAPLTFRLRDFLTLGYFGDVRLGQSLDELRSFAPEPDTWALGGDAESSLWSYGAIDLIFRGGRLHAISCDQLGLLGSDKRGSNISVDPWFLDASEPPKLQEVITHLRRAHVVYAQGIVPEPLRADRYDLVIGPGAVKMSFEPDDLADDAVVSSWRASSFWREEVTEPWRAPVEIVTVWLSGGPRDGDSLDVSSPLPNTITTSDGAIYENAGPELDEAGMPLTTWQYRWLPH